MFESRAAREDLPPPRSWEGAVEKQIREAMERGEFEDLPGAGKRLDLGDDPYTPADWQLAHKMLKDAGAAPDWIEQDKQIRAERDALAAMLDQHAQWQRERATKAKALAPDKRIAEHERLAQAREQMCARYRERAGALNQMIDLFNLKAPNVRLHHARIRVEEELQRFQDACR